MSDKGFFKELIELIAFAGIIGGALLFLYGFVNVQDYQTSVGQLSMILSNASEHQYKQFQAFEFIGGLSFAIGVAILLDKN